MNIGQKLPELVRLLSAPQIRLAGVQHCKINTKLGNIFYFFCNFLGIGRALPLMLRPRGTASPLPMGGAGAAADEESDDVAVSSPFLSAFLSVLAVVVDAVFSVVSGAAGCVAGVLVVTAVDAALEVEGAPVDVFKVLAGVGGGVAGAGLVAVCAGMAGALAAGGSGMLGWLVPAEASVAAAPSCFSVKGWATNPFCKR